MRYPPWAQTDEATTQPSASGQHSSPPRETTLAPAPAIPVAIALVASVVGLFVFVVGWSYLSNPAHSREVFQATQPVTAFGEFAGQPIASRNHDDTTTDSAKAATAVAATGSGASAGRMPSFALVTQYGETKWMTFPRERPVILALGDRDGARQVEDWIRPLRSRYADAFGASFDIQGVADLSDVPSVARSVVVLMIRDRTDIPVMLDWRGDLARDLGINGGELTVLVVAADGHIELRLTGRATEQRLKRLAETLDALIAAEQPGDEDDEVYSRE